MKQHSFPSVVCFGEILYDIYDDGPRLGGAPVNLAVHMKRICGNVRLISAVGRDPYGEEALQTLAQESIPTDAVARLPQPTGTVKVRLNPEKVPEYDFARNCAYDFINPTSAAGIDWSGVDLFCYGTLAQRGEVSRDTLRSLWSRCDCTKFYDVNLRQNFFSREILEESLRAANIVKCNAEELAVIADLFGLPGELAALIQAFAIDTAILTLGADGCRVRHGDTEVYAPAVSAQVVSTVGAGDAFSAAFLCRFLNGHSLADAAMAGNELAARVTADRDAF